MNNIEKILFETKYNLKFMNGKYYLSGFNHTQSIIIKEDDIYEILSTRDLCYMDENEWIDFIADYLVGN